MKEIVDRIIDALQIDDATTIAANDFTEERAANMIVVGIESKKPFHDENPFVPDYEYELSIVIDTFIDEDEQGELFEKTLEAVMRILDQYALKEKPLEELFGSIPVVGFWLEDCTRSISDKSNRAALSYKIVASF